MKLLDYVNIQHGTDSQRRFSSGNTLPLTALPHAHAAFAPQTNISRKPWWYHPNDRSVEGIRLTHQASPWINDFSYLCFMPQADGFFCDEDLRWSGFRREDSILKPNLLKINFLRYRTVLSLAPTDSGAVMELNFDKSIKEPRFAVLPFNFDSETEADYENNLITGYTTSFTGSPFRNDFKIWFVFSFDCKISQALQSEDKSQKISVLLSSHNVKIKMATSYISKEQALFNLKKETEGKSFDDVCQNAGKEWEDILSKIIIKADEETKKTFYSCLYRAFLYPTKFYETDKDGKNLHIVAHSGEVKEGVMYTNNGFWDTFRTVYPLYSILIPKKLKEILTGFLNFYDETGFLPKWTSPGECGCMPGTLIEAVYADAAVKGIFDKSELKRVLDALTDNAEKISVSTIYGRKCVVDYSMLGYVPFDKCHESVNETLDCAYGDYCISVVAETAGESEICDKYRKRSKNYRNLFDKNSGFFRAKDSFNNFRTEEFDEFTWGGDYTEGSVWQNNFAVQHDIEGLIELYGGVDRLEKKLDEVFTKPPLYTIAAHRSEIHEMTEMAAVDYGQCAISNQPSFHIPYIYSYIGKKEKTIAWVKRFVTEAFSSGVSGFPGDEDNGTMACWYIFSVLGFYPLCPGKSEYVISQTLASDVQILIDGKYKKLDLPKNHTIISHSDIIK